MWQRADNQTEVFCIEVPPSRIVLLQGLFESYDGIGVVKTFDHVKGIVCIITSSSMREECTQLLEASSNLIPWREFPLEEDLELLFEYQNVG